MEDNNKAIVIDKNKEWICEKCQNINNIDIFRCTKCNYFNYDVYSGNYQQSNIKEELRYKNKSNIWICEFCNKKNKESVKFCSFCFKNRLKY